MRRSRSALAAAAAASVASALGLRACARPAWADDGGAGAASAPGAASAASAASAPGAASAASAATVALKRDPPFDAWCVEPDCAGPSAISLPLRVPPAIAPRLDEGLIEAELRRAIAGALQEAATAAVGGRAPPAPVVDLARTVAAAALGDTRSLERLGGLAASALRAALVYEIDAVVAPDPACAGTDRIDALYEGLGVAAALSPLRFPLRRGRVSPGCAAVARQAARTVDGALLRALVPDGVLRDAEALAQAVEDARRACGPVPGAVSGAAEDAGERARSAEPVLNAPTLDAMGRALRQWREAPRGMGDDACSRSLAALAAGDAAALDALAARGLSGAAPGSLAQSLRAPELPCGDAASCDRAARALALLARLASGTATEGDVRGLVQDLASTLAGGPAVPPAAPVLRRAIAALPAAVVARDGTVTIDPDALLSALAQQDIGRTPLAALAGPTPWVFELNGGVPSVDFAQGKIVADASFGYSTRNLGAVGRGLVDQYDLSTSALHQDYAHYRGALEAWSIFGSAPEGLRGEARLSASFDYYDTTSYPLPLDIRSFYDFDSRIVRVTALAGLRYGGPHTPVAVEASAGAGAQYEDPDTTTLPGAQVAFKSEANLSAQGSARGLLRWSAVPRVLAVRLRGQGEYFRIARSELTLSGGAITLSNEQQAQLEAHGRLFVDLDAAALADFVPSAWAGVDYLNESGGAADRALLAPVLGIGVVRRGW